MQDIGWQDWIKDGQLSKTTGEARRLEAIEIRLEKKFRKSNLSG